MVFDGMVSVWEEVLSGIPQVSVLGPLLFTIYINDLVDTCGEGVSKFLFADDAKMCINILINYRHYSRVLIGLLLGRNVGWLEEI